MSIYTRIPSDPLLSFDEHNERIAFREQAIAYLDIHTSEILTDCISDPNYYKPLATRIFNQNIARFPHLNARVLADRIRANHPNPLHTILIGELINHIHTICENYRKRVSALGRAIEPHLRRIYIDQKFTRSSFLALAAELDPTFVDFDNALDRLYNSTRSMGQTLYIATHQEEVRTAKRIITKMVGEGQRYKLTEKKLFSHKALEELKTLTPATKKSLHKYYIELYTKDLEPKYYAADRVKKVLPKIHKQINHQLLAVFKTTDKPLNNQAFHYYLEDNFTDEQRDIAIQCSKDLHQYYLDGIQQIKRSKNNQHKYAKMFSRKQYPPAKKSPKPDSSSDKFKSSRKPLKKRIEEEESSSEEEEENNDPPPTPPQFPTPRIDTPLPYPFQSKMNKYYKAHPNTNFLIKLPDKNSGLRKKQLMRPNFANNPYSWEIDQLQLGHRNTYLFIININTRFLYVIPLKDGTETSTNIAFQLFTEAEDSLGHSVKNVKMDGSRALGVLQRYYPHIHFYVQTSKYTFHNKTIDSVMRTLRDALGPNSSQMWSGDHDRKIQQLVNYYNDTYHRCIKMTPREMHMDINKEWAYIRQQTEKLNLAKRRQIEAELHNYKPGERLMIHLDTMKTRERFTKRRRRFDRIGVFVRYNNGNCIVRINPEGEVEVPIFYTSRVPDVDKLLRETYNVV